MSRVVRSKVYSPHQLGSHDPAPLTMAPPPPRVAANDGFFEKLGRFLSADEPQAPAIDGREWNEMLQQQRAARDAAEEQKKQKEPDAARAQAPDREKSAP
jgi:hypothetical protein